MTSKSMVDISLSLESMKSQETKKHYVNALSSPPLLFELNRVCLLTATIPFSILFGFDFLLENPNAAGS